MSDASDEVFVSCYLLILWPVHVSSSFWTWLHTFGHDVGMRRLSSTWLIHTNAHRGCIWKSSWTLRETWRHCLTCIIMHVGSPSWRGAHARVLMAPSFCSPGRIAVRSTTSGDAANVIAVGDGFQSATLRGWPGADRGSTCPFRWSCALLSPPGHATPVSTHFNSTPASSVGGIPREPSSRSNGTAGDSLALSSSNQASLFIWAPPATGLHEL